MNKEIHVLLILFEKHYDLWNNKIMVVIKVAWKELHGNVTNLYNIT